MRDLATRLLAACVCMMALGPARAQQGTCVAAGFAAPTDVFTFADVTAFINAFVAGDLAADLGKPFGELTFLDIALFLGDSSNCDLNPAIDQFERATLLAPDGQEGDRFGAALAVAGNHVFVGAPGTEEDGEPDVGRVYMFDRETGAFVREIESNAIGRNHRFGASLAAWGGLVLVGEPGATAAHLLDAETGERLAVLQPDVMGTEWPQAFGAAVAINGRVAVVADPIAWDSVDFRRSGLVYVFDLVTGDVLYRITRDRQDDEFGAALDVFGESVLIGAPNSPEPNGRFGRAWIYDLTSGAEVHVLAAPIGLANSRFGVSVGLSATVAVVGAPDELRTDPTPAEGAAYIFRATDGAFLERRSRDLDRARDHYGQSVAAVGATVLIAGESSSNLTRGYNDVSAFGASGGPISVRLLNKYTLEQRGFGQSLVVSGQTTVVGAPESRFNGDDSGAVYLYDTPWFCSVADQALPSGFVGVEDGFAFIEAWDRGDSDADVAPPFGVLTFEDIRSFRDAYDEPCE